jgi:soluble lytic murein transglycosylase-like protein
MRAALIGAAGILAAAAYVVTQREAQAAQADAAPGEWLDTAADAVESAAQFVGASMWSENKIPAQYLTSIRDAEAAHGLPRNLLARLLWQECRYRPEIISGAVQSPAGALGIAQFMPATAAEMGIDPLNPYEAIPAAARYLARLYARFGSWDQALAAYNWGQGNVARKGLAAAPLETRNYFGQILSDLGIA